MHKIYVRQALKFYLLYFIYWGIQIHLFQYSFRFGGDTLYNYWGIYTSSDEL
jgi:hypothetical protein